MNLYDLPNEFRKHKEKLAAMEAHEQVYHEKLGEYLIEMVFDYWPELQPSRSEIGERLKELAKSCSEAAMDSLCSAEYYWRTGKETPEISQIPEPLSEAEAEKRAQKLFADAPSVPLEEWREIVLEDFDWEMRGNHFVYKVHETMKRGLTDFYLDYLLKFDSDHLLLLDKYLYGVGAHEFSDGVFVLIDARTEESRVEDD